MAKKQTPKSEPVRRILKTKRDREIINFLDKGFQATSDQLDQLFFNSPVSCRRRLVRMTEMEWIDRRRADETLPYVYTKVNQGQQIAYDEQRELTAEQETKQNKQLYLTQCLTQLCQLDATILHIEANKTLTTSVVDLLVVIEQKDRRYLMLIDVFNRDGNSDRHKTFFNNSNLYKQYAKEYDLEGGIYLVYAERMNKGTETAMFIKRPASLSYRDYKQVDWSAYMTSLNEFLNQ